MADLFAWLFAFFLLIIILALVLYQLMCLTDLEFDYINPYDSTSRINWVVWPEFVAEGVLCLVHLTAGHWVMFLLCLPFLYYNVKVYSQQRHLLDVTEIFNQLRWAKKIRLYKLIYLAILLALSIFWMIWSIVEE
ncbi:protein cornichon homolog 4-like [Henckelia pumila]|uniref:protein cornichon homolog 4-like n=1 Tax=Henckelia pumila TaxID=405737 RepID=UPI003C6DF968